MKWTGWSAAIGSAVWAVIPLPPGSLTQVFLLMPLVLSPLALAVLASLCEREAGQQELPKSHASNPSQPAVSPERSSNLRPRAGVLASVWLAFARWHCWQACHGAACATRVASRLAFSWWWVRSGLFCGVSGVSPRQLNSERVFLAATHFHFSGFLLHVLITATGRRLRDALPGLFHLQRAIAILAIAGIGLLLVGNLLALPSLKLAGVVGMVGSTLGLAFTSTAVARASSSLSERWLLCGSAASISVGMLLALIYGMGEFTGRNWIGLHRMVPLHGLVNALGFGLLGLLGHLARINAKEV